MSETLPNQVPASADEPILAQLQKEHCRIGSEMQSVEVPKEIQQLISDRFWELF